MSSPLFPHPLDHERIAHSARDAAAHTGSLIAGVHPHQNEGGRGDEVASVEEALLAIVKSALRRRGFYVLGAHELERLWAGAKSAATKDVLLRSFAREAGGDLEPGWTRSTALLRAGPAAQIERQKPL